jgi:hypothetical protein
MPIFAQLLMHKSQPFPIQNWIEFGYKEQIFLMADAEIY